MILFTGTILSFFSVPLSQIYQGLLSVFYNLGDGDFNLTMPSYRLDNGEWHDIHLDRHDNELTLRLDGGGGRREVTGSPGRSREIVIDPAVVMLGNSLPSGHNKSFQGKVQVCSWSSTLQWQTHGSNLWKSYFQSMMYYILPIKRGIQSNFSSVFFKTIQQQMHNCLQTCHNLLTTNKLRCLIKVRRNCLHLLEQLFLASVLTLLLNENEFKETHCWKKG